MDNSSMDLNRTQIDHISKLKPGTTTIAVPFDGDEDQLAENIRRYLPSNASVFEVTGELTQHMYATLLGSGRPRFIIARLREIDRRNINQLNTLAIDHEFVVVHITSLPGAGILKHAIEGRWNEAMTLRDASPAPGPRETLEELVLPSRKKDRPKKRRRRKRKSRNDVRKHTSGQAG